MVVDYIATGLFYLGYQVFSGNYRQVLFDPAGYCGVWPDGAIISFWTQTVVRGLITLCRELAYSRRWAWVFLGGNRRCGVETGEVLLAGLDDGRLSSGPTVALLRRCGRFCSSFWDSSVMGVLHGWNNFASMLTGWKKNLEYLQRCCGGRLSALVFGSIRNAVTNDDAVEMNRLTLAMLARASADRLGIRKGTVRSLFAQSLVKPYERRVYVTALALLRNDADAQDVAQ